MSRVTIAILGCAHVHTQTYINCLNRNSGAEISGLYDPDEAQGKAFAQKNGIPWFATAEALLEKQPGLALVCSENARHEQLVLAAAGAGVDVLCEKPLGISREGMCRMLGACERAGAALMTTFPNRYIHSFTAAKKAIAAGEIGALVAVNASNKGTMPGGWFVQPELSGGGCMVDHTVHVADLLNWLLGERPVAVQAACANRLFSQLSVDDVGFVHFRYPSGVVAAVDTSWSRSAAFAYGRDLTLSIIGTKGVIDIDYFAEHNTVYATGKTKTEWSYYGEDKDQMMIDDLVDAYSTGRPFMITGYDGYNSSMVALAAYESVKQGREVLLREMQ